MIIRVITCIVFALLTATAQAHDPLRHDQHRHDQHRYEHHKGSDQPRQSQTDIVESARHDVQRFRETGDDSFLDRAWERLQTRLSAKSADTEVLILSALVAQSRHQFAQSLDLLETALQREPRNQQAWILRASVLLVQGKTDEAAKACARLYAAHPLIPITCHARVALANGKSAEVVDGLQRLLKTVESSTVSAHLQAWSLSVMGDLLVSESRLDEAAWYYRRSLALHDQTQVRAALADIYIMTAAFDKAKALLEDHQALPLLVRQLIVLQRLGEQSTRLPAIERLNEQFSVWIANSDWSHAREMARYFLDVTGDVELAYRIARINVALQKEPEDLLLVQRTFK